MGTAVEKTGTTDADTLACSGTVKEVPYPTHESEFEVQAWLYSALRERGIDARGEVRVLFEPKKKTKPPYYTKAQWCRFDLVIFRDRKPVMLVEVKRAPVAHKNGVGATRQGIRYVQFGVPVRFVYGMEGARRLAEELAPSLAKAS